jgi:hypothetical protein
MSGLSFVPAAARNPRDTARGRKVTARDCGCFERARVYDATRGPVVRLIRAERAGTGMTWVRIGSQRYDGLNWNAHRHTVLHRHFLWRFPTVERPQAKRQPSAEISLARAPSWPFPPRRNARPRSRRISQPITRFVLPKLLVSESATWATRVLPYNHDHSTTIPLIKAVLCSACLKGPLGF